MGTLCVGAAKRLINLTDEMYPYPSFNYGNPFVGTADNLHVRAIVMDNGRTKSAWVGYDLGGIPDADRTKSAIAGAIGVPAEQIILSATHNHTGCDMVFSRDPKDQARWRTYMDLVHERTIEAVKAADAAMRPARCGYGEGASYINGNRDMATDLGTFTQGWEPDGYCDRTVYTMKFVDEAGKLIAAIVNYGMHATLGYFDVCEDGKTRVSGNIPGVAAEYAEARYGDDAVVLWTSGAAGDQNPYLYCLREYDKDGFPYMAKLLPGLQYQMIRIMGMRHGVDICRAIDGIEKYNKNFPMKFAQTYVPLPAQTFEEGVDMQWVNDITNHIYPLKEGEKLPEPIPLPDETVPLYVQEAVLGDVAVVGIAAEIYALIGKACREVSPYRKTLVVTHVDRSIGYVIDATSVDHYCFEQFGRIQAGVCDGIIAEGVRELFDEMNV